MKLYKQEARTGMFQSMQWATAIANWKQLYIPITWGEFFVYFKHNHVLVYWDEEQLEIIANAVVERAGAGIPNDWVSSWEKVDVQLTENARRVSRLDVSSLHTDELCAEYEHASLLGQHMWRLSIYIDAFDPGFDQSHIKRIADQHALSDAETAVLLTPCAPSYVVEWEMLLQQYVMGDASASEIRERFFWYANNYYEFGELTDAVIHESARSVHPVSFDSPELQQQEILAAHDLSANPLALFGTLTTWRDTRKRLNYTSLYAQLRLVREMLRRHGIEPAYANAVLPEQIEPVLAGAVTEAQLKRQFEEAVLLHVHPDGKTNLCFGDTAEEEHSSLAGSQTQQAGHEISGAIASRGRASGRARIIIDPSGDGAAAFQPGEILVTAMTRPEFMALIKRAGAIVTDEGGITSHAAIVSRELRIPCIIGTRTATQAIRDGDMVEVDAERGIVRKI